MNNDNFIKINYEFGKRVRFLREQRKLTQEELALLSDINKNYLSDIERGERNPTLVVIKKIANGLNITLEELFKGIGGNSKKSSKFNNLFNN